MGFSQGNKNSKADCGKKRWVLKVQLNLSTTSILGTEESGHCREVETRGNVWTVHPKKMAIVERGPYWRGGRIDFSGGLSVHSRQTANSYVTSPANKYKYIANLCLCIAMRYTHVPHATDLASTIYNTTSGSYNHMFLQPRVLTTKVPTTRGS